MMRKKILIVEDNSELLRLSLKDARYAVATAGDGVQALEVARTFKPDLVLLDLVLPELDGFGVCERLRRNHETARTPVIVLTGLSSEMTRLAGYEAGASDFVMKPASPGQILARIKQWLSKGAKAGEVGTAKKKSMRSTHA